MEAIEICSSDLIVSCQVLFGDNVRIPDDCLKMLRLSDLKSAYRKRVLETHPDRAALLIAPAHILEEECKQVNSAYDRLRRYLENPTRFRIINADARKKPARSGDWQNRRKGTTQRDGRAAGEHYFKGTLPARRLPLGSFMYYSGLISWKNLIDAIVWQKRQRPAIGVIAVQKRWIGRGDIYLILKARKMGERFGECAIRMGHLSQDQLNRLLTTQKVRQPRIGQYFVREGLLSKSEIERLVKHHNRHNWTFFTK